MSHDGFRGRIAESLVGANVGLHFMQCNGCLIGCSNCNFTIVDIPLKWVSVTIKILKQVEYESARRKKQINEKTRIRDEEGSTFFYVYLPFLICRKWQ